MPRSQAIDILGLICFLFLAFAAAAVGGLATASSVDDWYQALNKPDWQPPDRVFGPVWTVLYITIGLAGWWVWRGRPWLRIRIALAWYGAQLVLNALWSVLFFGLHAPGWALIEIMGLWGAIVGTVIAFFRLSPLAGLLLLPYLGWVTFAAGLNFAIWRLNTAG